MNDPTVLSSRVRLARNYEDFPFELSGQPEVAQRCVSRTANALRLAGADKGFRLIQLSELTRTQRESLAEYHIISRDLLRSPETAAVLLKEDESVVIMINEEDHLRIQAVRAGLDLQGAADSCFRVEDALSRQVSFAFDEQWGYLTAYPTNTGTGMRASLLMHLPMLTLCKQMGDVGQIVAKVGLTIRGVYGEGSEALGNLYLVSNQVTLGRTEQELIAAVTAVGHQLADMERALREKTMVDRRVFLEDNIYRSWGTMLYARVMPMKEFYRVWSFVRLGAVMKLLPVTTERLDRMLEDVQDANLRARAEIRLSDDALTEERARVIRAMLNGPAQEKEMKAE